MWWNIPDVLTIWKEPSTSLSTHTMSVYWPSFYKIRKKNVAGYPQLLPSWSFWPKKCPLLLRSNGVPRGGQHAKCYRSQSACVKQPIPLAFRAIDSLENKNFEPTLQAMSQLSKLQMVLKARGMGYVTVELRLLKKVAFEKTCLLIWPI